MRKIILIVTLVMISSLHIHGQRKDNDRIKAFKTAFITNALDLSSKEAQAFWPIYNEYNKTIHKVKNQKTRQLMQQARAKGGIDNISNSEAKILLDEFINIDVKVLEAKKILNTKLTGVIPPKKILKLFRAEQDFNKELLKRFRQKRNEARNKKN